MAKHSNNAELNASGRWFFRVPDAVVDRIREISQAETIGEAQSALVVYVLLAQEADWTSWECEPSVQDLASRIGASERTIRRGIRTLANNRLVEVVRRRQISRGQSQNFYRLLGHDQRPNLSGGMGDQRSELADGFVDQRPNLSRPAAKSVTTSGQIVKHSLSKENTRRERKESAKLRITDDDRAIANEILEGVRRILPDLKKPNLDNWANDIRLLRERDKRTPERIREVFAFANMDTRFWSTTILSPNGLKRNFDKIAAQMGQGGNGRSRRPQTYERYDPSAESDIVAGAASRTTTPEVDF